MRGISVSCVSQRSRSRPGAPGMSRHGGRCCGKWELWYPSQLRQENAAHGWGFHGMLREVGVVVSHPCAKMPRMDGALDCWRGISVSWYPEVRTVADLRHQGFFAGSGSCPYLEVSALPPLNQRAIQGWGTRALEPDLKIWSGGRLRSQGRNLGTNPSGARKWELWYPTHAQKCRAWMGHSGWCFQ